MRSPALVPLVFLSSALAFDYTVGVGKSELTGKKGMGFDPSAINPSEGDHIVWEFRSGSHSVVESTFEAPCTPKAGGYNSQVQTVPDNLAVDAPGLPQIRYTVETKDPLWFFDQAGGLCSEGAVISVNPTQAQSASQFVTNARGGRPASEAPQSATAVTPPSSSGVSPTSANLAASSPSASQAPASSGQRNGVAAGSIVGLVAAVFMGLL